jgi:putative membrane-bound dehydrogenase-like protein
MNRLCVWLAASGLIVAAAVAQEKPPRSLDTRLKIELFAEQPQIVTPTGIDVDSKGRVWALESNTHFPPPDYAGHKSDRLLVMQDINGDGRADQIDTFADGFTHAMSVAVRKSAEPDKPDQVYVATRREISILTDTDGDLRADGRKRIVHLETAGNYPHNGLAGFAWDAMGWMYFGFGENLGADYKIIGSDGRTLTGGGEGGNLYRCRPDGTQLSQWATGFWNPHASCIDAYGRMFTVDNDPDSRPPCRLLHIIRDGDYGYRFRNGRKGLHPFTAWNGEIPGTLPMVAGTGEAPSGILSYESDGLPEEYLGNLLVTSWGDHRIDRFRLKAKGASYESLAEPLIVGGENFRPVGLAVAPDGSLYCTDWVLKDYKLHGKGRVWHISSVRPAERQPREAAKITVTQAAKDLKTLLETPHPEPGTRSARGTSFVAAMISDDPFLFSAAVRSSSQMDEQQFKVLSQALSDMSRASKAANERLAGASRMALFVLLGTRQKFPRKLEAAAVGLSFPDPLVRRVAVQWVAEERLKELRPQLEDLLNQEPMTTDLFLAILAALEMLDGVDPANFDKTPAGKYVLPILLDEDRPAVVRKQALRLVAPDDRALKTPLFEKLLAHSDKSLRLEAVRTLQASPLAEAPVLLSRVAADEAADLQLRAEAIVGLGPAIAKAQALDPLHKIVPQLLATPALAIETLRALRGYDRTNQDLRQVLAKSADSLDAAQQEIAEELVRLLPEDQWTPGLRRVRESRPASVDDWMKRASEVGDAEAGRRVFFHVQGAGCWKCHTVDGRGGAIGPDLSTIARTMNRQKLAQSILEPAKEIAPQFTTWTFVMASGQTHQGMILGDTRDGKQRIGLADGRELELNGADIEQREPGPLSIMPANLIEQLTVSEFRHLLAFLESLK